ncbi:hypothetical protein [Paremcibacter congregatus]|jgi:hypothetical protein|uniref:hypothetical protein n=1 Tax=Paremcibacter congregatus TaxID=2043170 RepID=UPI0030EB1FEA|tara:strand:- start:262 stop:519 length:258 start_codon:yes stop_codon:yes gene_type:complete
MDSGSKRFEVSLYNKDVRKMLEQNKDHPNFNRDWAHLQFFTYEGETENDILEQVRKKYPERKGFVIDKVMEIKEYEFVKPVGRRS